MRKKLTIATRLAREGFAVALTARSEPQLAEVAAGTRSGPVTISQLTQGRPGSSGNGLAQSSGVA